MDSAFPFDLPPPTAFYLVLYVATFAIHQAFMHYVLAGSVYIAWTVIRPGAGPMPRGQEPLAATLRDWLPFGLSAAITAGVAPLLFVQIVYPQHFYTANLLLSWRWLVVIPVLIAAFYLAYLVKSRRFAGWPLMGRAAVSAAVASLLVFVGFCWTANHLVANHESKWPEVYASGRVSLDAARVVLRMLVWGGGAAASMAVIAGWQLAAQPGLRNTNPAVIETRRLAIAALGGLSIATAAAAMYLAECDAATRAMVLGPFAWPYVVAALVGVAAQGAAWFTAFRTGPNRWLLAAASAACLVTLVAASVLREAVRLAAIDVAALYEQHAESAAVGGLALFLVCAAVNTALIALCIGLVRRRSG